MVIPSKGAAADADTEEGEELADSSREPKLDFNDVFSLRKPRDAKAGLSSGLKSTLKGLAAGLTGLVAGPIIGAQHDGAVGCAKGLVAGVIGAVVLPVTGLSIGIVQTCRGVANTVEAVHESNKGRIWDQTRREWVEKPDGTLITAAAAAASTHRAMRKTKPGVDYYDVLQVAKDAPPDAIKKSYYAMARKWHPDKNPGDSTAHARFQLLGEAYQVLGNAELREKYDKHGAEALDVNFMDGAEFFSMLFGSEQFEHLVGELAIAHVARMAEDFTQAQLKAVQVARVDKLAQNLRALLQRYVAGDEDGFKMAMQVEAAQLAMASFGETMLGTIGRVYEHQADIQLGGLFGGMAAKFKRNTESVKSQVSAVNAAIKVYQAHQRIEALTRDQKLVMENRAALAAAATAQPREPGAPGTAGACEAYPAGSGTEDKAPGTSAWGSAAGEAGAEGTPGVAAPVLSAEALAMIKQEEAEMALARQALEEAALPLMLNAMWAANVLDIQSTLRKVCERVLLDKATPPSTISKQAHALRELGHIFQAAQAPPSEPTPAGDTSGSKAGAPRDAKTDGTHATAASAKRQMETAMHKIMEKRAGKQDEE